MRSKTFTVLFLEHKDSDSCHIESYSTSVVKAIQTNSSFLDVHVLLRHVCFAVVTRLLPKPLGRSKNGADGALCSGEGRRTTKQRSSDASETERLLLVPERLRVLNPVFFF